MTTRTRVRATPVATPIATPKKKKKKREVVVAWDNFNFKFTRAGMPFFQSARRRGGAFRETQMIGNVIAWDGSIPIFQDKVNELSPKITQDERNSLQRHASAVRESKATIQRAQEEFKRIHNTLVNQLGDTPPIEEVRNWCKTNIPSVSNIFYVENGFVVDFIANECQFNNREGNAGDLRLGDDERLILPPMRFAFALNNQYILISTFVGGSPRADVYTHPHGRGRDGACWGNIPIRFGNFTSKMDWISTTLVAIREWRKSFAHDVLTRPRTCQTRIMDIYKRFPESFSPIEGLDGNVYPTMTEMLASTPRGISGYTPAPNGRAYSDEEGDEWCGDCDNPNDDCTCDDCPDCGVYREDCDCCRNCGYSNDGCICETCTNCSGVSTYRGTGNDLWCNDCSHSFCIDCELPVIGRCMGGSRTAIGCEDCNESNDLCVDTGLCFRCARTFVPRVNEEDDTIISRMCGPCSSSQMFGIFRVLSSTIREIHQYHGIACPTCGNLAWQEGQSRGGHCECDTNSMFQAIRVWDTERHRIAEIRGNFSLAFAFARSLQNTNDWYCDNRDSGCRGRALNCICGVDTARCAPCHRIIRINQIWLGRGSAQDGRERGQINAEDYA